MEALSLEELCHIYFYSNEEFAGEIVFLAAEEIQRRVVSFN